MADIVTFDGVNKIITEIGLGSPIGSADNELDVVEIYSEWKEWVRTMVDSGLPAWRVWRMK